jgi:hypothetical protein
MRVSPVRAQHPHSDNLRASAQPAKLRSAARTDNRDLAVVSVSGCSAQFRSDTSIGVLLSDNHCDKAFQ